MADAKLQSNEQTQIKIRTLRTSSNEMNRLLTQSITKQFLRTRIQSQIYYYGHIKTCRRRFSDNMLGYSPMSQKQVVNNQPITKKTPEGKETPSSPGAVGPSWGVDSSNAGGGEWASSSAKKDKIVELKAELTDEQEILDDAATPTQVRDLHLTDGIRLVARSVDECWEKQQVEGSTNSISLHFLSENTSESDNLNKVTFEAYMTDIIRNVQLDENPVELAKLRLFVDEKDKDEASVMSNDTKPQNTPGIDNQNAMDSLCVNFDECTKFYRRLLVQSVAENFLTSWDSLTSKTSSDIDRAAVKGDTDFASSVTELPKSNINEVIRSFAEGNCLSRIEALWKLIDHDADGLIDQEEMDKIVYLSIASASEALKKFVEAATEASPMLIETSESSGWRQRRKEKKVKKSYKRIFSKSAERHFDVEVEIAHRLRCLYAWADKAHQDGKIDSVLIESGTIAGRKRYVELNPKISFIEFSSTKGEIIQHLDRVSEEIISSFREDLIVDQGKGRQNRELMRDSIVGITVISVLDAIIQSL